MTDDLDGFVDDRHRTGSDGTESLHDASHEIKEQWEWSRAFQRFVADQIDGYAPSVKVCTGLTPLGDDNVDIDPTLPGVTIRGDMFDLPIRAFAYRSAISDPPWKQMTVEDRETLFAELVRITDLGGVVVLNATWYPPNPDGAKLDDVRFRQEDDVWGNPSFAAIYTRHARDYGELVTYYEYDPAERHLPEDRDGYIGIPRVAAGLKPEANTNPKPADPTYGGYRCPLCGETRFDAGPGAEGDVYVCASCEYPASEGELEALEYALIEAAEGESDGRIRLDEIDTVSHVPDVVQREISAYQRGERETLRVDEDLPWVPEDARDGADSAESGGGKRARYHSAEDVAPDSDGEQASLGQFSNAESSPPNYPTAPEPAPSTA